MLLLLFVLQHQLIGLALLSEAVVYHLLIEGF
jgi:hypothetical protein